MQGVKKGTLSVTGSEDAEAEIFTTFKWNQYILVWLKI
jgi:hypothetical protein